MYSILNLLASFCFKECGTDAGRTWFYFIVGNCFGPLSLIFLMRVYAGMDANVAAALSMGLGAISVQVGFWLVYHVQLMPLQWAGIALAIVGGIIAVRGKARPQPAGVREAGETGEASM
jgi:multidrug transporter EmrE-like cation transporter